MTYRRDTLLHYKVSDPPQWCVAMGQGSRNLERVWFAGDDEPAAVWREQVTEVMHCPGLLKALQEGAQEHWQKGHDEGVASAMEGLNR